MLKRFLLTCSILATGGIVANGASAESLEEALIKAYQSNPTLESGRASLRATDEQVSQALSNWRPNVSLSGEAGFRDLDTDLNGTETDNSLTPYTVGAEVVQPLYRGGRTVAETDRAEARIRCAAAGCNGLFQRFA
jgi:outer membrane protein